MRLQQESKPEMIEKLDREIITLKIEVEALKKENDIFSKQKLEKVQSILREKESECHLLTSKWDQEKMNLNKIKNLKFELDKYNNELQIAQRKGNLGIYKKFFFF